MLAGDTNIINLNRPKFNRLAERFTAVWNY